MADVQVVKPGGITTEFWLGLIGVLLPFLNKWFAWGLPVDDVLGILATIVSYMLGRSYLKSRYRMSRGAFSVKKGACTTEFAMVVLALLLPLVNHWAEWGVDETSVLGAAALIIAYVLTRSYLKGKWT